MSDEQDAKRYRWLREHGDCDAVVEVLDDFHGVTKLKKGEALDAAIDAELAAERRTDER